MPGCHVLVVPVSWCQRLKGLVTLRRPCAAGGAATGDALRGSHPAGMSTAAAAAPASAPAPAVGSATCTAKCEDAHRSDTMQFCDCFAAALLFRTMLFLCRRSFFVGMSSEATLTNAETAVAPAAGAEAGRGRRFRVGCRSAGRRCGAGRAAGCGADERGRGAAEQLRQVSVFSEPVLQRKRDYLVM